MSNEPIPEDFLDILAQQSADRYSEETEYSYDEECGHVDGFKEGWRAAEDHFLQLMKEQKQEAGVSWRDWQEANRHTDWEDRLW